MDNKMKKICFASSSGGHFNQLNILIKNYNEYEHFIITEKTTFSENELKNKNKYLFNTINRSENLFFVKFIMYSIKLLCILIKERPDVVISTGALLTVPVCYICKFLGAKIIFIESFAKVKTPTFSGQLVYKIADKFIVQWDDMLEFYNNGKAEYGGTVY